MTHYEFYIKLIVIILLLIYLYSLNQKYELFNSGEYDTLQEIINKYKNGELIPNIEDSKVIEEIREKIIEGSSDIDKTKVNEIVTKYKNGLLFPKIEENQQFITLKQTVKDIEDDNLEQINAIREDLDNNKFDASEDEVNIGKGNSELKLGNVGHTNWAGIAQKNNFNTTNYALIQNNDGRTILNSKEGKDLHIRQGNVDKIKVDSKGKVGIGTSSPDNKLTVSGGAIQLSPYEKGTTKYAMYSYDDKLQINPRNSSGQWNNKVGLNMNSSGDVSIGITNPSAKLHVNGDIKANKYLDKDGKEINIGNSNLSIEDGNVGVGTTKPAAKLHVNGGMVTNQIDFHTDWINNNPNLIGNLQHIKKVDNNYALKYYAGNNLEDQVLGEHNFYTSVNKGWVDRMKIDINGNVGVGTTKPAAKLHVDGDIYVPNAIHLSKSGSLQTYPNMKNKCQKIQGTDHYFLDYYAGNTNENAGMGGHRFFQSVAGKKNSWKEALTIDSNSRIGINQPAPQHTLDVNGGINVSGGRSYFKDSENKGRVRIGAAWGIPGLYSEDAQDIVVGVASNKSANIGHSGKYLSVAGNGDVSAKGNINTTGNVKGNKLCIGNTCIDENQLKIMMTKHGYLVEYYNYGGNKNKSTYRSKEIIYDKPIDYYWKTGDVLNSGKSEHIWLTITGFIYIDETKNNLQFKLTSDDGSRLFINNNQVISMWQDQSATSKTSDNISVTEGEMIPFKIEWWENGGDATLKLEWNKNGSFITIPSGNYRV